MDYSGKTVCVIDNGLFPSVAERLAKDFGRVFYYSPWEASFPKSNSLLPGRGLPGVIRIDSFWSIIDEIDLFVFPDIFHGPLQVYLRKLGKRVWGSGLAESLEIERGDSKKWLRDLGLPVGAHRVLKGTAELRRHLQRSEDQYVKATRIRGDVETFHSKSYELIEPRLSELEHELGAKKASTEFVVEEPIEAQAEVGYDGFTIDGQYPTLSLYGIETKDAGYIGQIVRQNSLPQPVNFVNQKLAPLFRSLQYRGFWSSEIRVADVPYLIDPCCRMASPPGELYLYLMENLSDVIYEGAGGQLVEPIWRYKWGAELILKSDWAEHGWQPLDWPQEYRDNVKLHYHTVIGGMDYYVPQEVKFPEIGAVVAGGRTINEAINTCVEIAEQVKGYDVKFDKQALEDASKSMEWMGA